MLLDTSGVLAAIDAAEPDNPAALAALNGARPPYILSPFVLAELDYLVGTRHGHDRQTALLDEVARGAFHLAPFSGADVARAGEVIDAHRDLRVGLADASVVVLSERYEALDLLTLDDRHFRVLTGWRGRPFRILPADG